MKNKVVYYRVGLSLIAFLRSWDRVLRSTLALPEIILRVLLIAITSHLLIDEFKKAVIYFRSSKRQ